MLYVRREKNFCTVEAFICPEHKVKEKNYAVQLIIDENKEKIIKLHCKTCMASAGGCKHAMAFIMWVNRRTIEPSPTEVKCYWVKSDFSKVGTSKKYITSNEMLQQEKSNKTLLPYNSTFTKC